MRKALLVIAGFLVCALFGPLLLALLVMSAYWAWSRLQPPSHSGLGAVAGGLSEAAVMAVPVLFGIIGALLTAQRISRRAP